MTEANENLVGISPATSAVSNELAITFGMYANILFTVNPSVSISFAYDLDHNGGLNDFSRFPPPNNYAEVLAINSYITSIGGNARL